MAEEIKIRIHDYRKIERLLTKSGGKFIEEIHVLDTYFHQPEEEVLKVTEDDRGNFLVKVKAKNGRFKILKYDEIDNPREVKQQLTEKFGMKCILKKKRRFWNFGDFTVNINLIENDNP